MFACKDIFATTSGLPHEMQFIIGRLKIVGAGVPTI